MVTISAEKEETKEEKDSRYNRREYSYNSFSRSFTLPDDINRDNINATYTDGVLHVSLPKKEEAKRMNISKRIEVK
jgi:HSP20 family protein